jgi:hypothetical protein
MADTVILRQLRQLIRVKKYGNKYRNQLKRHYLSEDNKKHMHWEWVFPCRIEAKWQREESGIISLF